MTLALRIALLVAGAVFIAGTATAATAIVVGRDAIRTATLSATSAGAEATSRAVLVALAEEEDALALISGLGTLRNAWPTAESADGVGDGELRTLLGRVAGIAGRFEFVALLRPSGEVVLVQPVSLEDNVLTRTMDFYPWFDDLRAQGRVISDLHVSIVTRRVSVALGVTVRDTDGSLLGYLVGGLGAARLSSLVAAGAGGYFAYLTDRRGLVVAHGRDPRYATSQSDFSSVPAVQLALNGNDGAMEDHNPIEAEDRIVGYRSIAGLGWSVVYAVPASEAYGAAGPLASRILVATGALVILTSLAAMFLGRRALAPIARLAAVATGIAGGDRSINLPPPGHDEVGRLAGDFRQMVAAVDTREAELRTRADELVAANRELEAYTYSVSHDLRAPLRSIDGFGRILLDEHAASLDVEGRRLLANMIRNAGQMGQLIDDLLAFARTARGELKRRPVRMTALVSSVLAALPARQPGRTLDVTVGDLPDAWGDPALLRQVWMNLLGNAVKFTRDAIDPCVRIWAESDLTEERYFVGDNGVGFDQSYVEKLFQPFQRLHSVDEFEGTGIGLATAARIVQRHGGRIWAQGEPGKGATFAFALPRRKEAT
ncbi:MAG TPA: ATP-binding protein [Candidatus Limnocylindrales bacterium]|nr:ATP-binding protein [Candidatus Limnocylindrales bacterium]